MENKATYIIIAVVAVIAIIAIAAIILMDNGNNQNNTVNNSTSTNTTTSKQEIDYEAAAEKQMAMPEKGETIAIMHVKDYGDITFKFFKDVAPKAVENFLTHAKEGYYDGVTFHRVIDEFMIQGGDPLGNGTGGESIWGEGFEEEIDDEIVPYRGSLCMASSGTGTSSLGSQFFITQANYNEDRVSYFESYGYEDLIDTYKKYGGDILSLYKKYTVFGQVIDGMDVVDKIAQVETDLNDKPTTDVIIESIEVTEY